MYLIGYDLGSSSIKASIVDGSNGCTIASAQYPHLEMKILAHQVGWAEQNPEDWWTNLVTVTKLVLKQSNVSKDDIRAIGIAYQMHGLVMVDQDLKVIRPSIIWCDSRAIDIGEKAFQNIGKNKCLSHMLNSPGNFTASKLKWVKENEPENYRRLYKMMLPGDFIAMKMSNQITTTISGLSEMILWDFKEESIADLILEEYGIDKDIIPDLVDCFSIQAKLSSKAAAELGINAGTPITYRAGDQPNNALSLGVVSPNQVAATGGTSGVIYAVMATPKYESHSRVNGFAHVNHSSSNPRIGNLLCINGAGIQYAWIRSVLGNKDLDYNKMEELANNIPIGSEGLRIIPFGNGAERMIQNLNTSAQINNLQFNRHKKGHFFRASLEGVAFSFVYGFEILKNMGLNPSVVRVGNDNLFQSKIFSMTVASMIDAEIDLYDTNGATGAAKASGIAVGVFSNAIEAFQSLKIENKYKPSNKQDEYKSAYQLWKKDLINLIDYKR